MDARAAFRLPLVLRAAVEASARMSGRVALAAMGLHFLSSWAGYAALGEPLAAHPADMIYNYVVTGSSVGYGDLAPQGAAGRMFASFWVIPGAIAGFAWMIGKAIAAVTASMRKTMTGNASYAHRRGHVVVIGHVPGETATLLREIPVTEVRPVIVSASSLEGREPADADWVLSPDLSDVDVLRRAGIENASRVLVMTGDDDATLAACLALCGSWPAMRAVALFREARKARLLHGNCPSVEAVVSPAASLLARAADGPRTAMVVERLLSRRVDDSLNHATWNGPRETVAAIAEAVRATGSVLIAVGEKGSDPELLPDPARLLPPGADLYYLGRVNLDSFAPLSRQEISA